MQWEIKRLNSIQLCLFIAIELVGNLIADCDANSYQCYRVVRFNAMTAPLSGSTA